MFRWRKIRDFKKYDNLNIVEATHFTRIMCSLMGIGVHDIKVLPNDELKTSLRWWAVVISASWFSLYTYTTYCAVSYKETIQGALFKSMVKYNGEYVEMLISFALVCHVWTILTIFRGVKTDFWIQILKIDTGFRKLGATVNCSELQMHLFLIAVAQIFYNLFRCASSYYIISFWTMKAPFCKMFHILFTWNIIIICVMEYYFCAVIVETRHGYLNKVLQSIIDSPYGNPKVIIGKGMIRPDKNACCSLESEYVQKIDMIGKQYNILKDVKVANDHRFGSLMAMLTFLSYVTIVLRMFYIMEATAGGLYRDSSRYIFFIYCNIEFIFASLIVIFGLVHAADKVYNEDGKTAGLVHRLINQEVSDAITKRASLFSMQLLHQRHKFTANGLFKIDKNLLLTTLGSVTTYLIILLQFATSQAMDNMLDVDHIFFGTNTTKSN